MLIRTLLATLVLAAAPLAGSSDAAAAPRHGHAAVAPRHHHAARVSIATYRTSHAHKPVRELRAQHPRGSRTRLATTQPRHHALARGS